MTSVKFISFSLSWLHEAYLDHRSRGIGKSVYSIPKKKAGQICTLSILELKLTLLDTMKGCAENRVQEIKIN